MVVDFSFEELDNFSLKGGDQSVVAANIVGGSLSGYSPQVLILAGKEDLLESIFYLELSKRFTRCMRVCGPCQSRSRRSKDQHRQE